MIRTKLIRLVLFALWGIFLILFVASKIDFFSRYDTVATGAYLKNHSHYWAGMAIVIFVIWLVSEGLKRNQP